MGQGRKRHWHVTRIETKSPSSYGERIVALAFIFLDKICPFKMYNSGFPGGAAVKNPPANAGDTGSNPGLGRSHMPWSN